MARTESTMLPLGTPAPDFRLPDTEGRMVSLHDFDDASALLVMFLCNHCPFVKHIQHGLAEFVSACQAKGLAAVGISSNDAESYPEDDLPHMKVEKARIGYTFPYLYDETQGAAKAYRASCTPDFFLFDAERRLVYRGRFDASTPGRPDPVTGEDLARATRATLLGADISAEQIPSLGCNIKWKAGNEPAYFRG